MALARGRTPVQSDVVLNYLAHFAYELFDNHVEEVDTDRFDEIHRAFEQRYEIKRDASALKAGLVDCGIFDVHSDIVRFKYKYVYYYFIASWIRDHISDSSIRLKINELSRPVHIEENANILLFLAHLSKAPLIVREMLEAARSFYPNAAPAEFADDVKFLLGLKSGIRQVVYEERDTEETRKHYLATLDEQEAKSIDGNGELDVLESEPAAAILDPVVKFYARAARTHLSVR